VIILIVGLLLTWWGAGRERERLRDVQEALRRMCLTVEIGGTVAPLADEPTIVGERVQSRLATIITESGGLENIDIDVVAGDIEGFGMSAATHRATVGLGGPPLLGLRLHYADGETRIIGYWDP
jgi:hypothetical protein